MKKRLLSNKEVQLIELEMLDYFHELCEKNNLKYFLAGGTLLGAVRHKGFIPWDNDIDVAMPRDDYEKLMKIKTKELYKVESLEKNENYPFVFAKMMRKDTYVKEEGISNYDDYGIYIDIFPLDGVGNTEKVAKRNCKIILKLKKIFYLIILENNIKNILKRLIKKIFMKMNYNKIYNRIKKIAYKNNFYKSKYVGSVVGGVKGLKEIFEYRVYSETMDMEFEGKTFKGMKYYDEYLTRMYGDYMKLPPKDKRGGNHVIKCYKLEKGE